MEKEVKSEDNLKSHLKPIFYSETLKKRILSDQETVFDSHPEEKYRASLPGKGVFWQNINFLKLEVLQKSTNQFIKLQTYLYLPDNNTYVVPRAVIFWFHGMGSYAVPSAFQAKKLAEQGYAVASYDYRGHGNSEGNRGNIEDIHCVINDTNLFMTKTLEFLKEKYQNNEDTDSNNQLFLKNVFVSGISLGGFLSYFVSRENINIKGAVLFVPAFSTWMSGITKVLIKGLGYLLSSVKIPRTNKESLVAKNPVAFEEMDEVHKSYRIKVGTVYEFTKKLGDLSPETYNTPYALICGGKDKLVKAEGLLSFYEKSKSLDKEFWYYPNLWHGVFFEEEIHDIMERMVDWIEKRLLK